MKIDLDRVNTTPELERKNKLHQLNGDDKIESTIAYNWTCTPQKPGESIVDMHLFCVSVVRDILKCKIKTERGSISYDIGDIDPNIRKELKKVFDIISKDIKELR